MKISRIVCESERPKTEPKTIKIPEQEKGDHKNVKRAGRCDPENRKKRRERGIRGGRGQR